MAVSTKTTLPRSENECCQRHQLNASGAEVVTSRRPFRLEARHAQRVGHEQTRIPIRSFYPSGALLNGLVRAVEVRSHPGMGSLAVNVMYTIDDPKKRAVGFQLSEGTEVPQELDGKFKFARQKSKLAGTIRGSFFVIKGEH
jgi:hypothetical protein